MTVHVVAGGQFGSEGKGAFTAALVKKLDRTNPDPVLVRVAGPNAGHTAYDLEGNPWSLRQIPVGAVVNHSSPIVLGQQSEIDPEVLLSEVEALEQAGIPVLNRLYVDENATVLHEQYKREEETITTGTTGKGIGAGRSARLLRKAQRWADLEGNYCGSDTVELLRALLGRGHDVVIEGTQGYGLGLHTRFYPHVTSSNTRPGDFLAMTGLQPQEVARYGYVPWLVFRTYPIRIAGNSGPLVDELDWETVGRPVEYTTVTKLPRRVGAWDPVLATEAVEAAGGYETVRVAFTFVDYLDEDWYGADESSNGHWGLLQEARRLATSHSEGDRYPLDVRYLGTGPDSGVWVK